MSSEYLAKAKAGDVEQGNVITTSLPTDDAQILERGVTGSVDYDRYNDRFGNPSILWPNTFWDDLRVAVSSVRIQGASNIPAWGSFKTGLQVLWFDAATIEQVFFAVQIPHAYKQGTNLHPHVHWVPAANGGSGEKVSWGLEYSFTEIGSTFPATTTIYGNSHIPVADTSVVADRHYLTSLTNIDGSAIDSISSMLICRLFRDATGVGATDSYPTDAGLLEFDLHYEIDAPGSDNEYIK